MPVAALPASARSQLLLPLCFSEHRAPAWSACWLKTAAGNMVAHDTVTRRVRAVGPHAGLQDMISV